MDGTQSAPEGRGPKDRSTADLWTEVVACFPFGSLTIFDSKHRIVAVGGPDYAAAGLDTATLVGTPVEALTPDNAKEELLAARQAAFEGRRTTIRFEREGRVYRLEFGPVRDAAGVVIAGLTLGLEITAEAALEVELEKTRVLLDEAQALAQVGSWSFEPDTGWQLWTDQLYALYERPVEAGPMSPEEFMLVVREDARAEVEGHLAKLAEGIDFVFPVVLPSGRERWLRMIGRYVPARGDRPARLSGSTQDITDEKRRALDREATSRALARAKDEAEAAAQAKSDFLATMSHEMRTPLHGIIASSTLLEDHGLGAHEKELLGTIASSSEALLNVINDVLDLSKLEHGELELDNAAFSLAELVQTSLDIVKPRLDGSSVQLRAHIAPGVSDARRGDIGRLRQVLLNLLGNACKFTSDGEISLFVTEEEGLRFEVRDTGIGVPAERLSRLFKPFSQADSSTQRKYGGTGLGLAIVSRIAEAMDGKAWAESEPGRGSSFYFEAGVETDSASTSAPTPVESVRASEPLRVLVVDDNPVNRKVAERLLERLGHDAHLAAEGPEALSRLDEERFDLVLMDLQMPNMDGFETTRRARAREAGERTPIWALTASALVAERDRCLEAGFDDFLTKPLRLGDLRRVLETVPRRG